MACFSCGESFNETENERIQRYYNHWLKTGELSYYYRLEEGGPIFIIWPNSFNAIYKNEIKPNFKNGSEFARIDEYRETK